MGNSGKGTSAGIITRDDKENISCVTEERTEGRGSFQGDGGVHGHRKLTHWRIHWKKESDKE